MAFRLHLPKAKNQQPTANSMRNFRTLEIWQKGISLVKEVYSITEKLPQKERFGLSSQMHRSSVSIPSNIAEGCSRNSELEFKRFLEIAIGSSFELETQLILCNELGYFPNETSQKLISNLKILQKQTNTLISKLAKSQQQKTKSQKK